MSLVISVEEAIHLVLKIAEPLPVQECKLDSELLGMTLATDIVAEGMNCYSSSIIELSSAPFPYFPASIMDGYAVSGPLDPGVYNIQEDIHAGASPKGLLKQGIQWIYSDFILYIYFFLGHVAYITTGASLPDGANAVVKIEDTMKIDVNKVEIKVPVAPLSHVREIGSDIEEVYWLYL